MEHLGVEVRPGKYGLNLSRESYAAINNKSSFHIKFENMSCAYADGTGKTYTDEWCDWYRKCCLANFDLNMKYFEMLDVTEFNSALEHFLLINNRFKRIYDLNRAHFSGYYIMVLDKYKQIYVGTADDITVRIRQHWNKTKPFDRLLCPIGAVSTSILSIDAFRPLDTTRVYAYASGRTYINEDIFIKSFPAKFLCNRVGGGRIPIENLISGPRIRSLVMEDFYEQIDESIKLYSPQMQKYIARMKQFDIDNYRSSINHYNLNLVNEIDDYVSSIESFGNLSSRKSSKAGYKKTQRTFGKDFRLLTALISVLLALLLILAAITFILP